MRRGLLICALLTVGLLAAGPAAAAYKGKISGGTLTLTGDSRGGKVTLLLKKGAPGTLVVDVGSNGSADLTFSRSRFSRVNVKAGAGNDIVTVSDKNGVFTNQEVTQLFGGTGNDKLTGGKGIEIFIGGPGKDTLAGNGQDDVFVWDPGDGADKVDGGPGFDGLDAAGSNGNDTFLIDPALGGRVHVLANGALVNLGGLEFVSVIGRNGNDAIVAGVVPGLAIAADGQGGNDTLTGAAEADFLFGGDGNDSVDGNEGDDIVLLGDGDDAFTWNPGDGSDFVDGEGGTGDSLVFNGAAGAESLGVNPIDGGVRLTRSIDSPLLDVFGTETIAVNALGGADTVAIGALAAEAGVVNVDLDLGVAAAGDGAADLVTMTATDGNDVVFAGNDGNVVQVTGLPAQVNISNAEIAGDELTVSGLGGNDSLSGGTLSTLIQLVLDGGDGNDTLSGGNGPDTLRGGPGFDQADGNQGADRFELGEGNDHAVWDPGEGSDVVEGEGGFDTLQFNGSSAAEIFNVVPSGGRVGLLRSLGGITMDMDGVESLDLRMNGGADTLFVNDVSDSTLENVTVDNGLTDLSADSVTLNGSGNADIVNVSGDATGALLETADIKVQVVNREAAGDPLVVDAGGGNDLIGASTLGAAANGITLTGGSGADVIVGSAGPDFLNGVAGDDVIQAGDGADTIECGTENDYADGGPGIDTAVGCETVINVP